MCTHTHARGGAAPAVSVQNRPAVSLQRVTSRGNIWCFGHQEGLEHIWERKQLGLQPRAEERQGGKMESCFGCSRFGRFLPTAACTRAR